jgi:hypothetical protein
MKVLLDECVNGRLARLISGHDVETVSRRRWNGIKNGQLLSRAVGAGFDAFVTIDKSLSFQNPIASYPIAVMVLRAHSNGLIHLRPLVPFLLAALDFAVPGRVAIISGSVFLTAPRAREGFGDAWDEGMQHPM